MRIKYPQNLTRFVAYIKYASLVVALLTPLFCFYYYRDTYLVLYHKQTEGLAKVFFGASFFITFMFTIGSYGKYFVGNSHNWKRRAAFYLSLAALLVSFVFMGLSFVPTNWEKIKIASKFHLFYWECASLVLAILFLIIDKIGLCSDLFEHMDPKHRELVMPLNWTVLVAILFTLFLGEIIAGNSIITLHPAIENSESFSEGIVAGAICVQVIMANILFITISNVTIDQGATDEKK
ncbi:MAG: hypothetical protein WAW37_10065 [Syntrophobacteraceae bacterium]